MLGTTHLWGGAVAAAAVLQVTHAPPSAWVTGALILGPVAALLPDIDMPGSSVGHAIPGYRGITHGTLTAICAVAAVLLWYVTRYLHLPWPPTLWMLPAGAAVVTAVVAVLFRGLIRHRGPTHSLLVLALFALAVRMLWPDLSTPLWWSLVAGYASHMALDCLNPEGVALLWPLPQHWGIGLIRTGSALETVLCRGALVVSLGSILLSALTAHW